LITPGYVRTMADYNAEMNRRLYAAADRLPDAERRRDRGAFWGSIHGTLNHLLWGDQIWMSRFDGWEPPDVVQKDSAGMVADYEALKARRIEADGKLQDWATRVTPEWLLADLVWFSGAAGKEISRKRDILVMHLFNHQTHHRGQAHALLTAAGQEVAATDLPAVVAVSP
jgi:uncharacterized damage-inducible protein DinB